ncbi:hypothetical protein SOV_48010 [Sporomusa ovata DSM 2662]|uniref:hypothetical protein n=1 Tax=Sporomusa ovata TaxID=2378 RepID=UPI0003889C22|nr:hypothetical protein [Sporomusa ovata]EQB27178.1 hypothetical protein SOV_2c00700 [Sporomusa ovata DSM 2662]
MKKYGSDIILKSIQDYIQRVAAAFAAVLDYEVAVVGEYLEVLAGGRESKAC